MRGVLPNLEPPQELRQISAHSNNKKKQARVTVSQADCTRFGWKRQSRWSLTHSLHFDNIHTGVWVVSSGTDQSCQFVRKVDTPCTCNAQVTACPTQFWQWQDFERSRKSSFNSNFFHRVNSLAGTTMRKWVGGGEIGGGRNMTAYPSSALSLTWL